MTLRLSSWAKEFAPGDPDVCCRLGNGFSLKLESAMKKGGISDADVAAALPVIGAQLGIPLVEPPMPIQDAIDLAEFFVYATATVSRFNRGAAIVGGPIESVAITKHEGFKWIRRKHYYSEEVNPGRDV